jgi:hypothetical protein
VQPTVGVKTVYSAALPKELLKTMTDKRDSIKQEKDRPAKECAVTISGATGARADIINGIYEPTDEVCNDIPVYRRKDANDTWLECCKLGSCWKWYIKTTEYRGPKTLTSYGYANCSTKDHTIGWPQDVVGTWEVSTGKGFKVQDTCKCALASSGAMPAAMNSKLAAKQKEINDALNRPPIAGSVVIAGATGPRQNMVNGTYEPTDERCSGVPVYHNKDSDDYWLELCQNAGVWKWYVKATEYRGETNLTAYGYCACDADSAPHKICLPTDIKGKWFVSTGNGFKEQPVSSTIGSTGGATKAHTGLLETKRKAIKALLDRPPKSGSMRLTGASGPRKDFVNGCYEPISEQCNGQTVYHDPIKTDYYIEYIPTNAGVGRWYVKAKAYRGESNLTSYAYADTTAKGLGPDGCVVGGWTVSTGSGFVKQDTLKVEKTK